MKCLLRYQWVKLPRELLLPCRRGIMGHWTALAARAAFRNGQAKYCGYLNEVMAGSWAGGIVGLKSILGQKSRARTLEIMDQLSELGYITYHLDKETKKLTYKINAPAPAATMELSTLRRAMGFCVFRGILPRGSQTEAIHLMMRTRG